MCFPCICFDINPLIECPGYAEACVAGDYLPRVLESYLGMTLTNTWGDHNIYSHISCTTIATRPGKVQNLSFIPLSLMLSNQHWIEVIFMNFNSWLQGGDGVILRSDNMTRLFANLLDLRESHLRITPGEELTIITLHPCLPRPHDSLASWTRFSICE